VADPITSTNKFYSYARWGTGIYSRGALIATAPSPVKGAAFATFGGVTHLVAVVGPDVGSDEVLKLDFETDGAEWQKIGDIERAADSLPQCTPYFFDSTGLRFVAINNYIMQGGPGGDSPGSFVIVPGYPDPYSPGFIGSVTVDEELRHGLWTVPTIDSKIIRGVIAENGLSVSNTISDNSTITMTQTVSTSTNRDNIPSTGSGHPINFRHSDTRSYTGSRIAAIEYEGTTERTADLTMEGALSIVIDMDSVGYHGDGGNVLQGPAICVGPMSHNYTIDMSSNNVSHNVVTLTEVASNNADLDFSTSPEIDKQTISTVFHKTTNYPVYLDLRTGGHVSRQVTIDSTREFNYLGMLGGGGGSNTTGGKTTGQSAILGSIISSLESVTESYDEPLTFPLTYYGPTYNLLLDTPLSDDYNKTTTLTPQLTMPVGGVSGGSDILWNKYSLPSYAVMTYLEKTGLTTGSAAQTAPLVDFSEIEFSSFSLDEINLASLLNDNDPAVELGTAGTNQRFGRVVYLGE